MKTSKLDRGGDKVISEALISLSARIGELVKNKEISLQELFPERNMEVVDENQQARSRWRQGDFRSAHFPVGPHRRAGEKQGNQLAGTLSRAEHGSCR